MNRRYEGPVIDPHHHLWDLSLNRHPWLKKARGTGGEMIFGSLAPILRDYGVEEYRRDVANQNIVASVHVEAGWSDDHPLEETRWLDSLDRSTGVARRYVARVPLDSPDASRLIAAEAESPNVIGIRDIVSWHPDPVKSFAPRANRMSDTVWREGLRHLARHGLVFDLMLYPWQMEEAVSLVRDFPETLFVVNHGGSPADRSKNGMALWRDGLRALGDQQNVRLKISDLVAYDNEWTFESLSKVIHHCIECFGANRAMFASDFPVAGLHGTLDEIYEVFRKVAESFSLENQRALFFSTANEIYRLGLE